MRQQRVAQHGDGPHHVAAGHHGRARITVGDHAAGQQGQPHRGGVDGEDDAEGAGAVGADQQGGQRHDRQPVSDGVDRLPQPQQHEPTVGQQAAHS
jgi:hypothetical protein